MGKYYTTEQRKQVNREFFYRHILETTLISNEDDARTCFCNLSETYQQILFIRYGLDGGHKSASENFLIEQSGFKNALEIYKQAEEALKNQIYAESLIDKDCFDLEIAIALGMLATDVIYFTPCYQQVTEKLYNGQKLLEAFECINLIKRKIINDIYGIDGLGKRSLEAVATMNFCSRKKISQIKYDGLGDLRKKIKYFCVK